MKNKETKKMIFIIILLALLVFAAIFAFKFLAPGNDSHSGADSAEKAINVKIGLKKLNVNIFASAKFMKLKEYKVRYSEIKDLRIGKDNPFEADN